MSFTSPASGFNFVADNVLVYVSQTKEEVMGTLEAVQALQVQNGQLQKAREGYHGKCMELERLRKETAPQKELEKVGLKLNVHLAVWKWNLGCM